MAQYSIISFVRGAVGRGVDENAFRVYKDFLNHPNSYPAFMTIDVNTSPGFAQQLQVTSPPEIVFVRWTDANNFVTVTRLKGNVTYSQIRERFERVLAAYFDGAGDGQGSQSFPVTGEDEEYNPGISPFGGGKGIDFLVVAGILVLLMLLSRKDYGQ